MVLWREGTLWEHEQADPRKMMLRDVTVSRERKYEFETVSLRREQKAGQRRKEQEQQRQEKRMWQGVGRTL